jgi:hypothetical protein
MAGLRINFLKFISAISLLEAAPAYGETCGEAESRSHEYQAQLACESLKKTEQALDKAAQISALRAHNFCTNMDITGTVDRTLNMLCENPADFLCKYNSGNVFTSQCDLMIVESKQVQNLPSYVAVKCAAEAEVDKLLERHSGECRKQGDCRKFLQDKYKREIREIYKRIAFTPERLAKLKNTYGRVKASMRKMIESSSLVKEPSRKKYLLDLIRNTNLSVPDNECSSPGADGPTTGIFNDGKGKIHFCIGAIVQIETANELSLIHLLAHELAHSIDPCRLEELQVDRLSRGEINEPDLKISSKFYPGLLECMRGGKGPDGCQGALIHCNVPEGAEKACQEGKTKKGSRRFKECVELAGLTPSCPWGATDPKQQQLNLADYRKSDHPTSQIGEAFADFAAAEVLGSIALEDLAAGRLQKRDLMDGITSMASENVRLHGTCLKDNTFDEHPVGYLRMNRIIMGSKRFSRAFCGQASDADARKIGAMVCSGF